MVSQHFKLIKFTITKIEDKKQQKEKNDKSETCDWITENIPERVKFGELWRAGDNFILCANSLLPESFEIVMQGETAQIILTDPPYNVKISGHVCGLGKTQHEEFAMASGEMTDEEFENDFVTTYMQNCIKYSKDGSLHCHFVDWRHLRTFLNVGQRYYDELKNICVWSKSNGGGMGSMYRSAHEMICVFKHGKALI
ncbi:dNA modification methylase [Fusobacterium sp. CAG:439]|nr:dNA modification methylase [Fusobacterium sp. CAG:439]